MSGSQVSVMVLYREVKSLHGSVLGSRVSVMVLCREVESL